MGSIISYIEEVFVNFLAPHFIIEWIKYNSVLIVCPSSISPIKDYR